MVSRHDTYSPGGPKAALEALIATPARFSFDAAMAVLRDVSQGDLARTVRFRAAPGLATPTRDILSVTCQADGTIDVVTGFGGLTGHDGVLPRAYTALVDDEYRNRAPALAAFLDMLAQRPRLQFAEAAGKYTPRALPDGSGPVARSDAITQALMAFMGFNGRRDAERAGVDARLLLYFSGMIAMRPRSADRLHTLLEAWIGEKVEVRQFAGAWVAVPEDEQSRLGQAFSRLGTDAVIGSRLWDVNARIDVRIGPLGLAAFRRYLPSGGDHETLVRLIQLFVDDDVACIVTLGLKREDIPAAQLGASRLGADSWSARAIPAAHDAYDVTFPVERPVMAC